MDIADQKSETNKSTKQKPLKDTIQTKTDQPWIKK